MNSPAASVSQAPETPNPFARAEALEIEITDLCAQINAAGYRLLQLVAELDDEKPWGAWGVNSCAHWLNWRCGIGMNAAREKVRVAHALKQLPLISASFATGEISFSKVRAVTRIADPNNEKELLHLARYAKKNESEPDDVTAVTSEDENRFAKRSAAGNAAGAAIPGPRLPLSGMHP